MKADTIEELQTGVISVLSDTHCIVELNGQLYKFNRYCPHKGADLSKVGYYDNQEGKLRCGWHNLPFDLETGLPPCAAVGGINIEKYED